MSQTRVQLDRFEIGAKILVLTRVVDYDRVSFLISRKDLDRGLSVTLWKFTLVDGADEEAAMKSLMGLFNRVKKVEEHSYSVEIKSGRFKKGAL